MPPTYVFEDPRGVLLDHVLRADLMLTGLAINRVFDLDLQLSIVSFDAFLPLDGQSGDELFQCRSHRRSQPRGPPCCRFGRTDQSLVGPLIEGKRTPLRCQANRRD